jgi:hypothetical protein
MFKPYNQTIAEKFSRLENLITDNPDVIGKTKHSLTILHNKKGE